MPELSVETVRAVLPGRGWQVSDPVGSMRRARIARRDDRAVVVKLTDVAAIVARLADIGVTPTVLEAGNDHVVQEYVEGPHPDHAWFAAHLRPWADLVARYLHDPGLADHPVLPIHPDAHMHNYVLAHGRPYLIDWDGVDLSDVVRDVGAQLWGFLPHRHWNDFLAVVGLRPSAELDAAICWWSAFKMLRTALWVDDGTFHAHLFQRAVARRDWIT